MQENTLKYNRQVVTWSQKLRLLLKAQITTLTSKGKGDLVQSVRTRTKKDYGEIEQIDYVFSRHGIFFQLGAGRGYKIQSGKVIRTPSGESKVITVNRQPKDWLNPIDKHIGELADLVANYHADRAMEVIAKT